MRKLAALLVLAEVVVLLMGVTSRYVIHQPLVWSDELASILFLWLAMLGGVTKETIQWATAVYLIGAGVGLFNRLYKQSKTTAVNDDYGLFTARLLADPQLSGTAAVVGVLVTFLGSLGAGSAVPDQNPVQFAEVFNLATHPANLILAAVFGLKAPGRAPTSRSPRSGRSGRCAPRRSPSGRGCTPWWWHGDLQR